MTCLKGEIKLFQGRGPENRSHSNFEIEMEVSVLVMAVLVHLDLSMIAAGAVLVVDVLNAPVAAAVHNHGVVEENVIVLAAADIVVAVKIGIGEAGSDIAAAADNSATSAHNILEHCEIDYKVRYLALETG